MRHPILRTIAVLFFGSLTSQLLAHGDPFDLFANSETGRFYVLEDFEPGELELQSGTEISTTLPGLGISSASNGIAPGTELNLEITQELLFWDGAGLALPTVDIEVVNPAFDDIRTVSATSGEQTGLSWGTYPGGGSPWDAHGLYRIGSPSAPTGIYGLALRVSSPDYSSSKPFLLPLVYDPNNQWSATDIQSGIDLLRAAIDVPFSADFDGDNDVDGNDFLAWQRNLGSASQTTLPGHGDADFDSDIDQQDLGFWKQQFGMVPPLSLSASTVVPEPTSVGLLISAVICALGSRRRVEARLQ